MSEYRGSGREFGLFVLSVAWSVALSLLAVHYLLKHGYLGR